MNTKDKIYVSASLLGCDLANLSDEISRVKEAGADMIHFDVMDGSFVDNISFGIPVLNSISGLTDLTIDVHLMILHPLKYIDAFADAGADMITFHYESDDGVRETIDKIHYHGLKAGMSIKPSTPLAVVRPYLEYLDMILIMTVEPGFGGQGFIYNCVDKISDLRSFITHRKLPVDIQVDGGINAETAPVVREAGANNLVSGSYLFRAADMEKAVRILKG